MDLVQRSGGGLVGASLRLAVVLVPCAVGAGPAFGQCTLAYAGARTAPEGEAVLPNMQPAQQQPLTFPRPDPGPWFPSDLETVGMAVFIVVSVAGIILSWLTRLWLRSSATTDPRELARRDPWMQARMAQLKAARNGAPPDGARAEKTETSAEGTGERPE
jgi:hypothetical protein